MSTHEAKGGKNTASERAVQIVHGVYHDCPDYEKLYSASNAADAMEEAIADAIEHARLTGHENVDHDLLTESAIETCEDCESVLLARVNTGPNADDAHAPCSCSETEVSD